MAMNDEEKRLIDGLFDRLEQAEQETGERDPQASEEIERRVAAQPHSPYYMAQTIIIQEEALKRLNARVEELERNPQPQSSGGFLAGLFGGGNQSRGGVDERARRTPPDNSGFGNAMRAGRGGGFLGGALQTAAGVAGGVLLGNMLMDMFSGGEPGMEEDMAAQDTDFQSDEQQGFDAGADGGLDDFGDDDFL
ncbi:DUF2076 domain-containing protein [Salinicola halophilus]|uniref:DUF2076 domain-containing protein n=1 Tax=Salinicola halophilus TaxID=184065 RepID=UPI0019550613|nr:DUF2076 domain-containing protein [Salinicola halophilus]